MRFVPKLEGILTFLVFAIRGGWLVPTGSEVHYLSRAKHFWDSNWCPNDFFCNTPDAHAIFDCTFGVLTLFLPLPAVAVCGRLVAWSLLAWSWRRMSVAIIPVPFASVVSASLFAILDHTCHVAGEWVVGGIEAKCFSYVLLFLSIDAIAHNQWNRAWLSLGLAIAFHVLIGGWATVAAVAMWMVGPATWPGWRNMLPGIIGGAILALPGLLIALALTWGSDPEIVAEANRIVVFDRLSHHLWPLAFSHKKLIRHTLVLFTWAVLLMVVRNDDTQRGFRGIISCSIAISFVGWTIALALGNYPDLAASFLKYYWFRLSDALLPAGVAILGVEGAVQLARSHRILGYSCYAVVTLGCIVVGAYLVGGKLTDEYSRRDVGVAQAEDWRKVCTWIAANTPPDALFVTPCFSQTFRWYAGRSEVVNHKNCPQDANGIVEWRRRVNDLFAKPDAESPALVDTVNELGNSHVLKTGNAYGADYVLVTCYPALDLPMVGPKGLYYVVYQLHAASADGSEQTTLAK